MPASSPRVLVIGPVLPFRGGIAQHTTMLAHALGDRADVRVLSFSRQYPKALFPGESDRDPAYDGHIEPNTDYALDSVNPLSWRGAVADALAWKPDLAVIPWWTFYFTPMARWIAGRLRRAGVPVVFMCHNVSDHEAAGWKRMASRNVLSRGTGWVVHTNSEAEALAELVPGARAIQHPHPVYDQFPAAEGSLPRRAELELLFFGFVRPYKGLDTLLDAMALLPPEFDARLTVAGEFWDGSASTRERITALGIGDRVDVVDRYATDAEVAEYIARADAVVLPYRSATGSGVIAIAYGYDTPVIATRVGGLPDVVEDGVSGLLVEPDSPQELAEAIQRFATMDRAAMVSAVREFTAERLSWDGLAEAVLRAGGVE